MSRAFFRGGYIHPVRHHYMLKTYRYRLYPNRRQQELLRKNIDACRFVYNWALDLRKRVYEDEYRALSWYDVNKELTRLKKQETWLRDAYSQSLQMAVRRVDLAFKHFFRRVKNGETAGFPKFKSRRRAVQSFDVPQFLVVEFARKRRRIPKIGHVKAILHREFDGQIRCAVVTMTKTKSYFISIVVEPNVRPPEKPIVCEERTIGIDLGINNYATTSNGEQIENPRHLEDSLHRLGVLQRRLSRKRMGSRNRKKAKLRVAELHEKIRSQRNDFQHKLSTRLVRENQGIAVEDLNVLGMLRNNHLSRRISDAAWSSFLWMLEYKCEWNGATLIRIGRFEPTSKMCNVCGHKNDTLTLSDRDWMCPKCETTHDRDINAALNIKRLGLESVTPRGPGEVPVDLSRSEGMKQEVTNICR